MHRSIHTGPIGGPSTWGSCNHVLSTLATPTWWTVHALCKSTPNDVPTACNLHERVATDLTFILQLIPQKHIDRQAITGMGSSSRWNVLERHTTALVPVCSWALHVCAHISPPLLPHLSDSDILVNGPVCQLYRTSPLGPHQPYKPISCTDFLRGCTKCMRLLQFMLCISKVVRNCGCCGLEGRILALNEPGSAMGWGWGEDTCAHHGHSAEPIQVLCGWRAVPFVNGFMGGHRCHHKQDHGLRFFSWSNGCTNLRACGVRCNCLLHFPHMWPAFINLLQASAAQASGDAGC